jgi:hypothetical protein
MPSPRAGVPSGRRGPLSPLRGGSTLRAMTGDTAELDRVARDADRVVLCRCGGFGRVHHVAVNHPGEPERYVRSGFTCTWQRPGPHEPLLAPRPR